jgi:hypothetical protein
MTHAVLPPITEARFQKQILDAALLAGWVFAKRRYDNGAIHSTASNSVPTETRLQCERVLELDWIRRQGRVWPDQRGNAPYASSLRTSTFVRTGRQCNTDWYRNRSPMSQSHLLQPLAFTSCPTFSERATWQRSLNDYPAVGEL